MKPFISIAGVCCVLGLAITLSWAQPYGLSNRMQNTTLQLPPSLPVVGYLGSNALPGLTFTAPVVITTPPGETNRLFIVEQNGNIVVITNLASPTRTVFLNLSSRVRFGGEQGLLGLAFHPNYADNGYFYVFYTVNTNGNQTQAGEGTRHDRLSRFQRAETNPNAGQADSEVILINQRDEESNHNGGDLHFGNDGYLYVSLGDEGAGNDTRNNSQRIDKDFFAGILRLDVDHLPGSLPPTPHPAATTNYAVPSDNPFIGATTFNGLPLTGNVRTEFWAVGLRNPWRMSFDRPTGHLYVGDVGQGAREEIDIITRGGNYGWNFREGLIARPGSPAPPAGFMHINPILDYPRTGNTNHGNSVTGGVVYRGNRFPDLFGHYVFGDYGSGNIWSLQSDGTNATGWRHLFTDSGVAAFGIDPANGDVLYADVNDGTIRRIVQRTISGAPLPPTLAATGAFSDLATLTPAEGITGYDVNHSYWSDGAEKTRWFYIPVGRTVTFRPTQNWTSPTGSVWIQHFELELTNGVPESRRRLETRFLVRDSAAGAYGMTYRWDDSQTNAALVPSEGLDETFLVDEGGFVRTQQWRYPSQGECMACHTALTFGGLALGFNTPQLNRDYTYPNGVTDNQLRTLHHAGYFTLVAALTNLHALRALASLTNESVSVEQRARSYLAANCGSCHVPGGPGRGNFDSRIFTSLPLTGLINGTLLDTQGDPSNHVVVPGSLDHSMLLSRMTTLGPGRMPPLGSTELDTEAIQLFSRWITNDLANYQSFPAWQTSIWSATTVPEAQPNADPDFDRASNQLEYLTGTDPQSATEFWSIGVDRVGDTVGVLFPRLPNRGFEVQWTTNLFNAGSWQFLNTAENEPFFSATNGVTRVPDAISATPKFYRVRVYEP